jgi:hypothetical protein
MNKGEARSELRWVLLWAVTIVLLSSLPYLVGVRLTPPGYHFLGLTHNIDDGAVYLSWMRQAADGHFFIRNLFTNEPQAAKSFNALFLLMGRFAAITRLPLIWIYHIWRAALGIALIATVWRFARLFLSKPEQRKLLIPLVGLSAGVGWLFPGAKMPDGPVDIWQPEAITFLSIYLNPLFLAGLILMLWSLYFLTLAERTGKARNAAYAGLCLLLLGNIHTYDVVTVAAVWAAYVLVRSIVSRKLPWWLIGVSLLAAVIAVPSTAYQFWLYRIDPVFHARANSPTPSPAVWAFFAGYGLVLIGAITGATLWQRACSRDPQPSTLNPQLIVVWSVVGFLLPYIPVGQQRKLVMGLHIPLCILCAYALSHLVVRLSADLRRLVPAAIVLLMFMSNARFMTEDIRLLGQGATAPHYIPFLSSAELDAMRFLRELPHRNATVLAPPTFALFTPALAGKQVYYGHWSETPDYGRKLREWSALADPELPADQHASYLAGTGALFLVWQGRPPAFGDELSVHSLFSVQGVHVYELAQRGQTTSKKVPHGG